MTVEAIATPPPAPADKKEKDVPRGGASEMEAEARQPMRMREAEEAEDAEDSEDEDDDHPTSPRKRARTQGETTRRDYTPGDINEKLADIKERLQGETCRHQAETTPLVTTQPVTTQPVTTPPVTTRPMTTSSKS